MVWLIVCTFLLAFLCCIFLYFLFMMNRAIRESYVDFDKRISTLESVKGGHYGKRSKVSL